MSRLSQRARSKGSARGAGPARQTGAVRLKSAEQVRPLLELLRGRRMCPRDGKVERRCDECAEWVCEAPGHMAHRCGLEAEVCSSCWQGYYLGPGEPLHVCREATP